ncbi:hypothetical protein [uncultured Dubosiella sp.]|uniref:hypothetical protein n=1 Tax=uncultured Dubosiella sp. TaxID=1937011 RepID=UPI0027322605|nr:hypothetical protein [uncultured Dubosiella sp.]
MKYELDFSLVDQINRSRERKEAFEWSSYIEAAKAAGKLEAKIMYYVISGVALLATLCLETPH